MPICIVHGPDLKAANIMGEKQWADSLACLKMKDSDLYICAGLFENRFSQRRAEALSIFKHTDVQAETGSSL